MRPLRHADVCRSAVRYAFFSLIVFLVLMLATAGAQTNPVVLENQQPGSTGWDLDTSHAGTDAVGQIKGYASTASVNKGQNITFYVSTNPAQTYTIDVYRVGWYQGLGGRLMQHIGPINGGTQPPCPRDATTGKIECNWAPAYTLATLSSWTSGVYLAVLTNAQGFQNYMIFVVRDDTRVVALLYQQPVTTYQAYNNYPNDGLTGKSLYDFNSYGAQLAATGYKSAAKVSFDRPYSDSGIDEGFRSDYGEVNFIRWMEQAGYDVTYATDVDTHSDGDRLVNYRGFLSVGHDEYWSGPMYDAAVAARDAGVNLGFFGADALGWQIRFEPSSSGVPNRVVVCYKDVGLDPITTLSLKTIAWRDPVLNRPEQTLMGVQSNQYSSSLRQNNQGFFPSYVVNNSGHWVYAGTGFKDGDSVIGLVGYEADLFDSAYPAPTAISGTFTLLSHSSWGSGPHDYSNASVYQAPSGAWIFATGTMSWNWALDSYGHGYNLVDARIQQTTANVFNRLIAGSGAQSSPTVSSVTPASGPTTGCTAITMRGTNVVTGATVSLGGSAATNVSVVNSTTITATTAAHAAGAVSVTVTNPGGQSGTLPGGFAYTSTPPAIGFVQVTAATPQAPTGTVPVTYPGSQTAGDLNIVVVGWNDTTAIVQSVQDTAGNVYSLAIGPTSGTGVRQSIYYAKNILGGNNTVTVTFTQPAIYPDIRILEYKGVSTLDVTAGASGRGSTSSSGSATTTAANALIFGANTVSTDTRGPGSGFRTSSSKWTICSGEREVVESLGLPRSYDIRLSLYLFSEMPPLLTGQKVRRKALIFQAAAPSFLLTPMASGSKINGSVGKDITRVVDTAQFRPSATGGPTWEGEGKPLLPALPQLSAGNMQRFARPRSSDRPLGLHQIPEN